MKMKKHFFRTADNKEPWPGNKAKELIPATIVVFCFLVCVPGNDLKVAAVRQSERIMESAFI